MSATVAREQDDGPAGPQLHELIRQGHAFSGRERHCCFLNLGGEVFADVSAGSGLDFPDDGRGLAQVDWDHDGDLDFWVANRNGPQVRFLQNNVPGEQHWLAVRLVGDGQTSNRDAIGARVLVWPADAAARPWVKTVRAGDGFLAQSSKWLHFGLGDTDKIDRVEVRWPGGNDDTVVDVQVDGRYEIQQGNATAHRLEAVRDPLVLAPARLAAPAASDKLRMFSAAQTPLPPLEYRTFDGDDRPATRSGRAVLINLWASWCRPCLVELADFAQAHAALADAGVDVLALSVDGIDGKNTSSADARKLVERKKFPFAVGMATVAAVEKLQLIHDHLLDQHRPLAVPTSLLVDARGDVVAIYKGPVGPKQVLHDVELAGQLAGADRFTDHLPFAGRWRRRSTSLSPHDLAWELADRGYVDDAAKYVAQQPSKFESHYNFPKLVVLIGNHRLALGDAETAAALYRHALKLDADYSDAQNNLAWVLATHPDGQLRDGAEAVRLAEAAVRSTGGSLSTLDTLAAAYAEAGRFDDAVATIEAAVSAAQQQGADAMAEKLQSRLPTYKAASPYRAE